MEKFYYEKEVLLWKEFPYKKDGKTTHRSTKP